MAAQSQYIEQVIEWMERAAEANRSTLGRVGNVIKLSAERCKDVLVTGDLHGHRRNFVLIRRAADLAAHPKRHLVLQEVAHGGPSYENGGCMSHCLLEDVARLKLEFPDRVHFLLSNHELSEATGYPIQKGRTLLNLLFRLGLDHMYGTAAERVQQAYNRFILTSPLAVRLPGGLFLSHSVPAVADCGGFDRGVLTRPLTAADLQPKGAAFRLVWDRDYSQRNAEAFADLVDATLLVTGHEPCQAGYSTPNSLQVVLDCSHAQARYLLLEAERCWSQPEALEQLRKL